MMLTLMRRATQQVRAATARWTASKSILDSQRDEADREAARRKRELELFYVDEDYNCPIPRTYWIETSAICNLRCPFCPTANGNYYNDVRMMSFERYAEIFEKIKDYALYIYFHRHGEPTLNKDLFKIIRHTTAHGGIYTLFSTNLNTLRYDDARADELVRSGISEIICSIDGASSETYAKYRRGGSFERAIGSVSALAAAKERLGSTTPKLNWQFLVNAFNEHEVEKAKEMAAELKLDIYFNLMDVWGTRDWISSFHRHPEKLAALNSGDNFPQNKMVAIAESPAPIQPDSPLPDHALAHIDRVRIHGHFPVFCAGVFHTMAINTDGSVSPCTEIADSRFNLGNILETGIHDLWNSDEFKKSRRYIMHKQLNGAICEACVRGEKPDGSLIHLRLKKPKAATS